MPSRLSIYDIYMVATSNIKNYGDRYFTLLVTLLISKVAGTIITNFFVDIIFMVPQISFLSSQLLYKSFTNECYVLWCLMNQENNKYFKKIF